MYKYKGHVVLTMDDILETLKAHTQLKQQLPSVQSELARAMQVRGRLRRGLRRGFEWTAFMRLLKLNVQIREVASCVKTFKRVDAEGTDPSTGSWWPPFLG